MKTSGVEKVNKALGEFDSFMNDTEKPMDKLDTTLKVSELLVKGVCACGPAFKRIDKERIRRELYLKIM